MLVWKHGCARGEPVSKSQRTETWHKHLMRCFSGIAPGLSLQKGCSRPVGLASHLHLLDKTFADCAHCHSTPQITVTLIKKKMKSSILLEENRRGWILISLTRASRDYLFIKTFRYRDTLKSGRPLLRREVNVWDDPSSDAVGTRNLNCLKTEANKGSIDKRRIILLPWKSKFKRL